MPCICLPWRSFVLATGGTLARIRRHHNSPRLRGLLGKVTVTDFGSKGNVTDLEKYQNGGGGEDLNENFQVLSSHQVSESPGPITRDTFPFHLLLFRPFSSLLPKFYSPSTCLFGIVAPENTMNLKRKGTSGLDLKIYRPNKSSAFRKPMKWPGRQQPWGLSGLDGLRVTEQRKPRSRGGDAAFRAVK